MKHTGRLELTWTGKDKALLSTGDGKYDYTFTDRDDPRVREVRLLHEIDRVNGSPPEQRPDGLPEPTNENLLITGDAMHVLDALLKTPEWAKKYLGQVKLAYIDPPFNTGQAFEQYEDNIEHSIWLTMLRDRIRQIRPLLASDGSVWVHLDHVESHRCRVVLDEEFGASNFVAEVAWQKAVTPRNNTSKMTVTQDALLVYRKSEAWQLNRLPRLALSDSRHKSQDGDPTPWRDNPIDAPGASTHQGMVYAIQHPITGELLYTKVGRCWGKEQAWFLRNMSEYAPYELREIDDVERRAKICGVTPDKVRQNVKAIMLAVPLEDAARQAQRRYDAGNWPTLYLTKKGRGSISIKAHQTDIGRIPATFWPASEVGANIEGKSEIQEMFPGETPFATPKPERLLRRVVQIASRPGDIVLDCFAGSGTTAAVAHKLGRRWVTSEIVATTVAKFTKPRLTKVVNGEDMRGITVTQARVMANENGADMTPDEAREFTRLLGKVTKSCDDLDEATLAALKAITKTREESTVTWHGGGGFVHLAVGPSMYEVDNDGGEIFLSANATNGAWSQSVAAQLRFTLTPDHPVFCGVRGRQRLAVIDGVADEIVVRTVVEYLGERERAIVVAKIILPEAEAQLSEFSPGSRMKKAPRDLFPKRTVR
jgi:adenine-specific DNA-methyltransferase